MASTFDEFLVLYMVVHRDDLESVNACGAFCPCLVSKDKAHVALRVKVDQAQESFKMICKNAAPDNGIMIRVAFSASAILRYTTTCVPTSHHAQMLSKRVWWNDNSGEDYGVWHFLGDLPIREDGMVRCTWDGVRDSTAM